MIKFGSVCSGIEAASVAWKPYGWQPAWFSEIEAFPSELLKVRYPGVRNIGDMKSLPEMIRNGEVDAPDLLCGGTPCQAFSFAGQRRSLDDERGNLTLTFVEIANAIDDVRIARGERPCVVFWENVPGVLSTRDNAFGCFLAALAGEDEAVVVEKWPRAGVVDGRRRRVAWCVLDSQYFGVAQRRRRVYAVAVPCELIDSIGDRADPAEILLIGKGSRRNNPTRSSEREIAPTIPARSLGGGGLGTDFDCDGGLVSGNKWPADYIRTLDAKFGEKFGLEDQHTNVGCPMFVPYGGGNTKGPLNVSTTINACGSGVERLDFESETFLVDASHGSVQSHGQDAQVAYAIQAGALRTNPRSGPDGIGVQKEHAYTIEARAEVQAVAVQASQSGVRLNDVCGTLDSNYGSRRHNGAMQAMQVRRLTPKECERLMGFEDDYTLIPWRGKPADQCPDSHRYKALGNSWAVPVVRWIGQRIHQALMKSE